jgi:glycosyltransferase involved in cell wall biosynthesis
MKISVLIIAHNEEKYIERCINSILNQTQKADEIVLIAHNCTDKTIEIVHRLCSGSSTQKFPITVVQFEGEKGIVHARLEGLKHVSGDIVLCVDGDSYAENNWISEMISKFGKDVVLIGSWVKLSGSFYNSVGNFFNKLSCTKADNATHWVWASSFGFLGRDKDKIEDGFQKSIEISDKLKLSRNPDDYILALFMKRYGNLKVTNKTYVTANMKERGFINEIKRSIENIRNGHKVERFLKKIMVG